jgi:hypothetical protein
MSIDMDDYMNRKTLTRLACMTDAELAYLPDWDLLDLYYQTDELLEGGLLRSVNTRLWNAVSNRWIGQDIKGESE